MQLSIIVPAYNEAEVVARVVGDIRHLYPNSDEVEILVVDDGSIDGTGDAAAAAGARVLCHPYNKGNGSAIKTGISGLLGTRGRRWRLTI